MNDTDLYEYWSMWNDPSDVVTGTDAHSAETHSQATDMTSGVHGTRNVSEPQVCLGKYMVHACAPTIVGL